MKEKPLVPFQTLINIKYNYNQSQGWQDGAEAGRQACWSLRNHVVGRENGLPRLFSITVAGPHAHTRALAHARTHTHK